jgi:hypothetical protein
MGQYKEGLRRLEENIKQLDKFKPFCDAISRVLTYRSTYILKLNSLEMETSFMRSEMREIIANTHVFYASSLFSQSHSLTSSLFYLSSLLSVILMIELQGMHLGPIQTECEERMKVIDAYQATYPQRRVYGVNFGVSIILL